VIRGAAPDHITFEFRRPRDCFNMTDYDAPSPYGPLAAAPTWAQDARAPRGAVAPRREVAGAPAGT
jgi:hypothetical protein